MSNQNVPPILIQDPKEFKENPKLLKQAIEQDLRGIKIKQIKFTKNNNMLLFLEECYQYKQLTDENSDATLKGKKFNILKSKLFPFVIKSINHANIQ